MNPGKPLPAGTDLAAQPQPVSGQHLGQGATRFVQNHSETDGCYPGTLLFRRKGLFFPVNADLRQKIIAGRAVFIQKGFPPVAVVPGGRGADQNDMLSGR